MTVGNIKTLFLEQSYKDCTDYLKDSIDFGRYESWDYVVLTASNEEQAKSFRLQIEQRKIARAINPNSEYLVVADPDGLRVGSGGATLNALAKLKTEFGCEFTDKKILLIHSGGDSKRIPQYSATGKLFSPVPRLLTSNLGSTLFDELLATASIVPSRMKDGVMVMSGDVMLLFNPLQIDFKQGGVAAVAIKKSAEIGKNHGVFVSDKDGSLLEFLHKKTIKELIEKGAVDSLGNVNIDTGIIMFDSVIAKTLLSLVETNGKIDEEKSARYVNDVTRLSFYGDFLYPFGKNATFKEYLKQPAEGTLCEELVSARKILWDLLSVHNLQVMPVSPAEFLHFGTTQEQLKLVTEGIVDYAYLGWQKRVLFDCEATNCAIYHSSANNCKIGDNCYLENAALKNCKIERGSVVSFVGAENIAVPSNTVLSGLKLDDGKYVVRIYGVKDDPKQSLKGGLFGIDIDAKSIDGSVWTADLYPIADTMQKASEYAIMTYNLWVGNDKTLLDWWQNSEKISLKDSFNRADVEWLCDWQAELGKKITIGQAVDVLRHTKPIADMQNLFNGNCVFADYAQEILAAIPRDDVSALIRFYYFSSKLLTDRHACAKAENAAFAKISEGCATDGLSSLRSGFVKNAIEIRLPARVNWGGGWTDTPPYCVENGGTVLNCAINICGERPIVAEVERLTERKFLLESKDADKSVELTSRDEILACGDPFDPVALQKACLVSLGIVMPSDDADLSNVFDILGGGLKLSTAVYNIPRGSGLGTSSILAAATVKAVLQALGQTDDTDTVSERVLAMEQIMSTGGGWQDQIGGLLDGVKLIKSQRGVQKLSIWNVNVPTAAQSELKERFVLIYTGQRRLARNLLRDIVGKYLMADTDVLTALKRIEELSLMMARELERGDIDRFANVLSEHWEYSKMLDKGSSNTCIDYIFAACDDLLQGKMICGAGGGGFLQAILKKGVTKSDLTKRLNLAFADSGVAVWDSELEF